MTSPERASRSSRKRKKPPDARGRRRNISQDPTAFLGYQCGHEGARAFVLPIPYEETTTYLKGTRYGPGAIIEASQQVELYDEEFLSEPYLQGIHTLDAFVPAVSEPGQSVRSIEERARSLVSRERTLVSLGGEHTITIGLVRAHKRLYPHLSVLQIDAHTDLRQSYEGSPYSHACVMYHVSGECRTVQVGIRAMSAEEVGIVRRRKTRIFPAREIHGHTGWIHDAVESLSDQVYLTIDLDGLDPSLVPSVGTPEPGGLGWYETLALVRILAREKIIVGFDVVELRPQKDAPASDFLAARLAYKVLGYIFNR